MQNLNLHHYPFLQHSLFFVHLNLLKFLVHEVTKQKQINLEH